MKKYICIMLLNLTVSLSAINGQFVLERLSDRADGFISRFASYLTVNSGNWIFLNTSQVKYSDIQDNITGYYMEGRAHNQLHAIKESENWSLDIYLGAAVALGENHLTEIAGSESLVDNRHSMNAGGSLIYDDSRYYLKVRSSYIATTYAQYDQELTELGDIREYDLIWQTAAGYRFYPELLLTANYHQFDDLNENDYYNNADFFLRTEYSGKLNYMHYLQQEVRLGNNDLDESLNTYLQAGTRLSSRFSPDWTLLNRINWRGWLDDEIYLGNSWWETSLRRNISLTENNQLSFIQIRGFYQFDTEVISVAFLGRYYLENIKLFTASYWYAGSARCEDYKTAIGGGYEFFSKYSSVSYQYQISKETDKDAAGRHQLSLEYSF